MKFRIIKGGPGPGCGDWVWSHTIQIRKLRWLPYPWFVWEDYKLGPWFGRFSGGTAYAQNPDYWMEDEFGYRTYYDKDHRGAKRFIEREKARIEAFSYWGRLKRKIKELLKP